MLLAILFSLQFIYVLPTHVLGFVRHLTFVSDSCFDN